MDFKLLTRMTSQSTLMTSVLTLMTSLLIGVGGQKLVSPCPDIFQYELPGSEQGRWYGVVTLSTDITLHGLWLDIILDNKADVLGNWAGEVKTEDNMNFKIENSQMKMQPGSAETIRFFVQYKNSLNKIPTVTEIRLNGREICGGSLIIPAVGIPSDSYDKPSKRPESSTPRPGKPGIAGINEPEDYNGPVYVPPRKPSPNSMSEGGVAIQSVVSQSDKKKPPQSPSKGATQGSSHGIKKPTPAPEVYSPGVGHTDFAEYSDSESSGPGDYFEGGLPTITTIKNPPANTETEYQFQEQCGKVVMTATPLVVNGKPTSEGQWPWQIALYQRQTVNSMYICGGTLVSRSHVITAAHCVTKKQDSVKLVNKNTLSVYLGKHNLRTSIDGVQHRFVDRIIVHPQYNASVYSKDLSVLKLRKAVDITEYVRTACLWPEDQVHLSHVVGRIGSVVGWGYDETNAPKAELTLVEMPVVDQETCIYSYREFFSRYTSEYTFCAGYRDGTSVCNGDSGGGMVFKIGDFWYLRGLVSVSVKRKQDAHLCDASHYVVFTDVAKFLPWIKSVLSAE